MFLKGQTNRKKRGLSASEARSQRFYLPAAGLKKAHPYRKSYSDWMVRNLFEHSNPHCNLGLFNKSFGPPKECSQMIKIVPHWFWGRMRGLYLTPQMCWRSGCVLGDMCFDSMVRTVIRGCDVRDISLQKWWRLFISVRVILLNLNLCGRKE